MSNIKDYQLLLIDDHQLSQKLLSRQLEIFGFCNIDFCSNGKEGLESVKTKKYDIIMIDRAMPVMNGIEFLEVCKQDLDMKDVAFVMVSAEAHPDEILSALSKGVCCYIAKPVDQDTLNEQMRSVLAWLEKNRKSS